MSFAAVAAESRTCFFSTRVAACSSSSGNLKDDDTNAKKVAAAAHKKKKEKRFVGTTTSVPPSRKRRQRRRGQGCSPPLPQRTEATTDSSSRKHDDDDTTNNDNDNDIASLILIGGRGCGKSALCKRLVASDPRFTLRSLDDMIVEDAGMSIPKIVERRGWRWFRDAEFAACERVVAGARERRRTSGDATPRWTLVDAGGGVVVDLDDRGNEVFSERKVEALRGEKTRAGARENVLVYLKRDVGYLMNRTAGDRNRPRLSGSVSFATLMERRAPWYFRAADYVVDAAGGAVESEVKSKREIKREVLEYFYAETGGWPAGDAADDDRRRREGGRGGG